MNGADLLRRRALQIMSLPQRGDYMLSLYRNMPPKAIVRRPLDRWLHPQRTDLFHVNVPERLVAHNRRDRRRYLTFIAVLGRSDVRVVWTMHSRRPHRLGGRGDNSRRRSDCGRVPSASVLSASP